MTQEYQFFPVENQEGQVQNQYDDKNDKPSETNSPEVVSPIFNI